MSRLELTHIILHHTAAEEKDTAQIRRYHLSKGWQDIGYDYVIEKDGNTVEGRSLNIEGAHAGVSYYNQHGIGIAVIGNLSKRDMYPSQFNALVELLVNLINKWRITPDYILLHREIKNTECPGSRFPISALKTALTERLMKSPPEDKPITDEEYQSLLRELEQERTKNKLLTERVNALDKALIGIQDIILQAIRRKIYDRQ